MGKFVEKVTQRAYEMVDYYLKLSRNELAKLVSRYNSIANKRIKRIDTANLISPAIEARIERLEKQGKSTEDIRFSVKGKNLNQLRKEYAEVIGFLNLKTSTVTGTRKFEKEFSERFLSNRTISADQRKVLFSAYRKGLELYRGTIKSYGSDNVINLLANVMDEMNVPERLDDNVATAEEFAEQLFIYFDSNIIEQLHKELDMRGMGDGNEITDWFD